MKAISAILFAVLLMATSAYGFVNLGNLDPEEQHYFEKEFTPWLNKYQHHYSQVLDVNNAEQLSTRFSIWKQSYQEIMLHNRNPERTYDMGLTAYAAMTFEEFKRHVNVDETTAPQHCSATAASTRLRPQRHIDTKEFPESVDWRHKGVVSPVKDQGRCGSCWAFSSTGCLEAHWAIKTGKQELLSEQQLVDCAGAFDNNGCRGGLPSHAFEYIKHVGGIVSGETYPYTATDGQCKFDGTGIVAGTRGSHNITEFSEDEVMEAVATVGPVAIAYQVVSDFRLYKSGVYQSDECKQGPMDVNHAVLVVGYGTTKAGVDYWIVKNSWGVEFGMEGYFWMFRGKNMCGLATCSSYPIL